MFMYVFEADPTPVYGLDHSRLSRASVPRVSWASRHQHVQGQLGSLRSSLVRWWMWPLGRRRRRWEYWAMPVRKDNARLTSVSVDREPHNNPPPNPAIPSRGYTSSASAAPQAPTRVARGHPAISVVPFNIATARALLRRPLAHRADG